MHDKPFALIGVNVNEFESRNLKERMAKEKMNWRSFVQQEAINARWNPSTPTYYVLDPRGVIRHKWVGPPGERAIDRALEKLIQETEANAQSRGIPTESATNIKAANSWSTSRCPRAIP